MKKFLLAVVALLLSTAIFAQEKSILIRETFDSDELPSGWSTSDNSTANWSISETNKAGGEANELKLSPTPQAVGFIRVITDAVDLTGYNSVIVSFKHYFAKKSTGTLIGIATSSNNGNTWSSAWTKTYSEEDQYSVVEEISTSDMGKNNVKFCIFYQGNTNNIVGWYFDDFEVLAMENIDAKAESIDIPDAIAAGKHDVTFSIQNVGLDNITSLEAKYTVGGVTVSETFPTDIAQFETKQFTFTEQMSLYPGEYNIEIDITAVNGGNDQNTTNNSMRKDLSANLGGTKRIAFIEHFSSATCASCMALNRVMKVLTDNNPGKYAYTKYAMNFPSYGDDYYTAECGVRRNYYNVEYVPTLILNGKDHSYLEVTQEELDANYNSTAFVNIKGAFDIDGTNINIKADVMSYINLEGKKLFINVNEKTTVENVEPINDTDSSFHHIMMKMITGTQGEPISLTEGTHQHFEYTYDMSQTHIEDINDLEVAVWVQDYGTKEVYNSNFLYEYTEHPYPAQNLQINKEGNTVNATWETPETGSPTGYDIYVNNSLVAENTDVTSYTINNVDKYCSIEVVAHYADGRESVGVIAAHGLSLTENEDADIAIYPNPAKDNIRLSAIGSQMSSVRIYNSVGMMIEEIKVNADNMEIEVSDYVPGIYFFSIQTEKGNVVKKFVKI